MADNGSILNHRAPYLDVEVFIIRFAVGGKDVVAGAREMVDVPIKGLEMEVAPCATHSPIVSRVSGCGFKIICKVLPKSFAYPPTYPFIQESSSVYLQNLHFYKIWPHDILLFALDLLFDLEGKPMGCFPFLCFSLVHF